MLAFLVVIYTTNNRAVMNVKAKYRVQQKRSRYLTYPSISLTISSMVRSPLTTFRIPSLL